MSQAAKASTPTFMVSSQSNQGGFSLIETLAALAILGLLASTVVVNLTPIVEERRFNSIESAVENAISAARIANVHERRSISLINFLGERHPELTGFVLLDSELKVVSRGACNEGQLAIEYAGRIKRYSVSPITCSLTPLA
ncbi:MAG: prepilin-type N-terminal cleavage/methylation domain-containing protein [Henriciella sp.]